MKVIAKPAEKNVLWCFGDLVKGDTFRQREAIFMKTAYRSAICLSAPNAGQKLSNFALIEAVYKVNQHSIIEG